jgi:hypothetical protein
MAKRFTDTDKWTKNKWFRKLSKDMKLFWLYILDNCDCVGVWDEDIEFACELLGLQLEKAEVLEAFKIQVKEVKGGKKWWIKNFCLFQYGQLIEENIKNKPHQRYISELKKHSLWGDYTIDYVKTIHSLEEKEEEEDISVTKESILNSNNNLNNTDIDTSSLSIDYTKGIDTLSSQKVKYPWDSKEFAESWNSWKKYKREKHVFSFTLQMEQLALEQLWVKTSGDEKNAIAIINEAIASGWKNLVNYAGNKTNANTDRGVTGKGILQSGGGGFWEQKPLG